DELAAPGRVHGDGREAAAVDERRAEIVDRTKQTGDIAQWTSFGTSLRDRGVWFAFEIDDVGIAARDQDLAEMKISMDACHQGSYAGFGEFAEGRRDAFTLVQQCLRTIAILVAFPSLQPRHRFVGCLDSLFGLPRPICSVTCFGDFRRECRIRRFARQYRVQLAKALADRSENRLAIA